MTDGQDGPRLLLTGFTGFLGQYLAAELLRTRPGCRILALVRPASMGRARALTQELAAAGGVEAGRIELLAGTIDQPGLGLGDGAAVAAAVHEVFHLGAVYDLSCPLAQAMEANVRGTRHVLEFAARCRRPVRLHYTSTCYVAGTHRGVFREDDLDVGQGFLNNYDRTKFIAEQLVASWRDRLAVTVYRPAVIVGHAVTGRIVKLDGPYLIMEAMVRLPAWAVFFRIGSGRQPANLVPVDFVAAAMAHLSALPDSAGRTYHLADADPLPAIELQRALMRLLDRRHRLVPMPSRLAALLLRPTGVQRLLRLPAATVPYLDYHATFDTAWAARHLGPAGIVCPRVLSYLPVLVDYWRRARRAATASQQRQ